MNELAAEIVDIVEPVHIIAQGAAVWLWVLIALLGVVSALAVTAWWFKNRDRLRSLRRLRQLRREFSSGQMTTHTLAYRLAAELCKRFAIHRLSSIQPVSLRATQQRDNWCAFVAQLDRLRYQAGCELDPLQADALLRDAYDWAVWA